MRGGFGGAWYDNLDTFYPERTGYFAHSMVDRNDNRHSDQAVPKVNPGHFDGPLVVLVNNGTRSGKEALPYQFKHSGRAALIGATTQGAFTAGKGVFAEASVDYMLYLAVSEFFVDGQLSDPT